MAIVPIDNVGLVGLSSDKPVRELTPEAWSNVLNVRFRNRLAERSHGEEQVFGTPGVAPHFAIPLRISGANNWVYADGTAIYKTDGSTHTDITRLAGPYTAGTYPRWTGCVLGGVLLMNNHGGSDYPQYYNGVAGKMADLTNWPVNTYAKVLRSFKQFAVALDITDASGNIPYRILWSHPADPGTVPSSWNIADATKDAGDIPASETEDILVDGRTLGEAFYVYKERSVWIMQYIGGQQIMSLNKRFDTFGALSTDCVESIPEGHFVVARGDVIVHDGASYRSIISGKNRDRLFNNMSNEYSDYTKAVVNKEYKEVWIFYVEEGSAEPYANKALIWNWEEDSWTERDVPNVAYAANGIYPQLVSGLTWDTITTQWDATTRGWNRTEFPTNKDRLIMCGAADTKFYMADQSTTFDGSSYSSFLERTGLGVVGRDRFGEWRVDQEAVKFIRNIYPKIDADPGAVINIYLAVQLKPNAAIEWQGPFPFVPETDTKIDCTITTKLFGIRFSANGSAFWRMYGYDIDMDVISRY